MASRTVPEMFLERVAQSPDRTAFMKPTDPGWTQLTWKQTGDDVRAIACGLRSLGLKPEERVAILSGTRLDWILADIGILCGGGATTTIYPSSTPDECAYIISDSATAYVFAENDDQIAKLVAKKAEIPTVRKVITFDGKAGHDGWVITLDELRALGKAEDAKEPDAYERIARSLSPESLATLIYTSGTTGKPKGVELTHDCWVYEGEGIDALGILKTDDVQYLWLPLAHSFGKVLEAAQIRIGFATAVDGRIDKLVDNLAAVQPTFVAAVPRIFEKVHNKVVAGATEAGGLKASIFRWAVGVGREWSRTKQAGKEPGFLLGMQHGLAHKLVFSKLHARFGGKLRCFISGSAPLSKQIAEFFDGAGIVILEGYGLTESSAASFVNLPARYKIGTVGKPLPGTEVKIAPEDGEILLKGRGIMRGYHGMKEATEEALTPDRWLRTGDIGELDADGYLKITDRKKDLIKTSGGKYVAPQYVEGKLKAMCPYLSQVVVHGDNRNFCSALITLDPEAIQKWGAANGFPSVAYSELTQKPEVNALIKPFIDKLNAELPSYETLKKFAILPNDLTQEAGDLTPSLKLKRKAVEKKYKDVLDAFYAGAVKE